MTARHDASPPYVRFLSSLIRPFPDFDFAFVRPLRAKAVALTKQYTLAPAPVQAPPAEPPKKKAAREKVLSALRKLHPMD